MSIEIMKQALEALEANVGSYHPLRRNAITSLRQAIATEESSGTESTKATQEPVAWGNFKEDGTLVGLSQHPEDQANWTNRKPLYTHPQPKEEQTSCYCPNCEALSKKLAKQEQIINNYPKKDNSKREWVGLTDDERLELAKDIDWAVGAYCEYAEAIEAKLKEKNFDQ